jgi:hypothetical protein
MRDTRRRTPQIAPGREQAARDAMQRLEDETYTPADFKAFYALHAGDPDVGELTDRLEVTFG